MNRKRYGRHFRSITFCIHYEVSERIFAKFGTSLIGERARRIHFHGTIGSIGLEISLESRLAIGILVVCKHALICGDLVQGILVHVILVINSHRSILLRFNLHVEPHASRILTIYCKQVHLGNTIRIFNGGKFNDMIILQSKVIHVYDSTGLSHRLYTRLRLIRIAKGNVFQRSLNINRAKIFFQRQGVIQFKFKLSYSHGRIQNSYLNRVVHIGDLNGNGRRVTGPDFVGFIVCARLFNQMVRKDIFSKEIFLRSIGKGSIVIKDQGSVSRFIDNFRIEFIPVGVVIIHQHRMFQSNFKSSFFLGLVGIVYGNRIIFRVDSRQFKFDTCRFFRSIRSNNLYDSIALGVRGRNKACHMAFVVKVISQLDSFGFRNDLNRVGHDVTILIREHFIKIDLQSIAFRNFRRRRIFIIHNRSKRFALVSQDDTRNFDGILVLSRGRMGVLVRKLYAKLFRRIPGTL